MMKPTTPRKSDPVTTAIRNARTLEIYAFATDGKRLSRLLVLRRPGARGKSVKIGMTTISAMKNHMIAIARGARKPRKGAPKLWMTPRTLRGALAEWFDDSMMMPDLFDVKLGLRGRGQAPRSKGARRPPV